MKKFLLLLFAVLLLGCTGAPETKRDVTGVEIQEFQPDLGEVQAGNDVLLRLKVQNVGDSDAKTVEANIYKCGNLKVDGACPHKYSLGNLEAADISSNLPGKEAEKILKISTADVNNAQNERTENEIGLKLSYDYESVATAEIPLLSNARYKELERQGTLPRTKIDTALAPVMVDITAPDQAIGSAPITLDIGLEKQVDGYAEGTGCGAENHVGCITNVKIELSGKGLGWYKCTPSGPVKLWRTGKTSFSCSLKPSCPEGECYSIVKVTAKYTYVAEATTSITVAGNPAAGGVTPVPVTPEEKSNADIITLTPTKGSVPDTITVKGTNFNKNDKNIHLYIEGNKYWIENGQRQNDLGMILVPLTPTTAESTQSSDGYGVDIQNDNTGFTATFEIPHAIAMPETGAEVSVFARGDARKDKELTKTEGYLNKVTLEVSPKAKITLSHQEGQYGDGIPVEVSGAKFPPNKDITLYFIRPDGANYLSYPSGMTNPPIKAGYPKDISSLLGLSLKTDTAGNFHTQFTLNDDFRTKTGISSGYYLLYATADGINARTSINGAADFSILFGEADEDKDGIPDSLDVCPGTPHGVTVCTIEDAKAAGPCFERAGCEKLPVNYVSASLHVFKITSDEETGTYSVTYDENKDYPNQFIVKKNGKDATLTEQSTDSIQANDALFVFQLKNNGAFDITSPMDAYIRGLSADDLPTETGHCMGITLELGKDIACALLKKDLIANTYNLQLRMVKDGQDYITGIGSITAT